MNNFLDTDGRIKGVEVREQLPRHRRPDQIDQTFSIAWASKYVNNFLDTDGRINDQTFSIAWASKYVNNFLDTDGRIKKVYVHSRSHGRRST
ncbi:hypothetical protein BGV52_09170 [Burkholderia ubonensis]|uniref:hypothetical protein n=1 Tax=Burkholderia ubonensis TaxID=101571 RepID=UPI0008FDF4FB|nr:hypothetical protein [Burkholderia ubonensis]OJB11318.1 hypothetical protein BGV52_09170 [Burkholderia ubonensis]